MNSSLAPFIELSGDVLCKKENTAVSPDEFVLLGVGLRGDKCKIRAAIERRNFNPTCAGFKAMIHHQPKTKLVEVKPQTPLLIANIDHDEVQAEIGILPVQPRNRSFRPKL